MVRGEYGARAFARNYFGAGLQARRVAGSAYKVLTHPSALSAYGLGATAAVRNMYNAYQKAKKSKAKKKDKVKVISNSGATIKLAKRPTVMSSKRKTTVKSLDKRLKDVQCLLNASCGELVYRNRSTGSLTCSARVQNGLNLATFHQSYYEGVLQQLRYYDPTTPSTLVTADGATGSFSKDFCFTSNYAKLTLRNNYQVPVEISIYNCQCKTDTSIDPFTAWSNGLADTCNVSYSNDLTYPTDSDQIVSLWNILKTTKKQLEPGESLVITHSVDKFDYDPAVADSQIETYRKEHKGFAFMIAITGVLGHDTSAAERTRLPAGVDYELDRVSKVKYDAGANIKYIYCVDNSASSFTNGGVVSLKPISDNLAYSVS